MEHNEYLSLIEIIEVHNLDVSILHEIHQVGLLKILETESGMSIDINEVEKLEKIIRLHKDLKINLEGIDAIFQLLDQISVLENEMMQLKNKLAFYE